MTELNEAELFEAFEYLDELRSSGRTNMWGATPFIQTELLWQREEARQAHKLWMDTFDGEADRRERVAQAIEAQRAGTTKIGPVRSTKARAEGIAKDQSDDPSIL